MNRDNIDDASATVAALRAEVAAQRELLEGIAAALTPHATADWIERGEYELGRGAHHMIIFVSAKAAVNVAQRIDAIRSHLAGAAVPAEAHVFRELCPLCGLKNTWHLPPDGKPRCVTVAVGIGDTVRVTGESGGVPHNFEPGDECEVVELADGFGTAEEREAINVRILTGRRYTQWIHPRDIVLVRKAGVGERTQRIRERQAGAAAASPADVAAAIERGDYTACATHVHEVASGTGKPGTGLITERCRCGARRVADYRGMTGELGEPRRSAWKGGKP
jgi:hypothetical protein